MFCFCYQYEFCYCNSQCFNLNIINGLKYHVENLREYIYINGIK